MDDDNKNLNTDNYTNNEEEDIFNHAENRRKNRRKRNNGGFLGWLDFIYRVMLALFRYIGKGIVKGFKFLAEKISTCFKWLISGIRKKDIRAITVAGIAAIVVLCIPLVAIAVSLGGNEAEADVSNPNPSSAVIVDSISYKSTDSYPELSPSPVISAVATSEPTTKPFMLSYGMTDAKVATVQQKLMDLSYMEPDETTEYYGSATTSAVKLFQKKNGLDADGTVGDITYNLLFSSDAKEYVATVGDNGTDIEEMQHRLYELGYLSSKGSADGSFGTQTEEAVKRFQEKNKLTVDGKLGPNTKETLYSEDVIANSFSLGDESEDIKKYQNKLKKLGYLTTEPDGKFGKDTLDAIKRFQSDNGLIVDGYVGPATKELLMSSSVSSVAFKVGDSGDQVEKIQKRLKELNYLKSTTGYFGSDTEAAVKAFQKRNGLTQDGKVGPATLEKLNSKNAKKASSGSSSSGGSSSKSKSGVDKLIAAAESKLGCPYVLGAKGPNKFDCSGLAYWCINQAGVKQSYMTSRTWRTCTKYKKISSMGDIKRGDIIIYKMSESKGHVGIAVSGSTMIDASSSNGKVVKRSFTTSYWKSVFYCAYRIF